MAKNLQFMDCPHCGKRMVTTAAMCGHCRKSPRPASREAEDGDLLEGDEQASGGYAEDEWSYEEYLEREFPESRSAKKLNWVQWTAIVLLIAMLLPLLMNLLAGASRR